MDYITVPKHTTLYKGMSISCKTIPRSVQYFFVTEDPNVARLYASTDMCVYRTTRPLRLFAMTRPNIEALLTSPSVPLTYDERRMIAMITGVLVSKKNQVAYFGDYAAAGMRAYLTDCSQGERFSHHVTNKLACVKLCAAFAAMGFDGYYAEPVRSVFHSGEFHREMMLCNASKLLEIVTSQVPLLSSEEMIRDGVLRLFLLYAQRSGNLLRFEDTPDLTPMVAPETAVHFYRAYSKKNGTNNKTNNTNNTNKNLPKSVDILVYLHPRQRQTNTRDLVRVAQQGMTNLAQHFVDLLNREYHDLSARLNTTTIPVAPQQQHPGVLYIFSAMRYAVDISNHFQQQHTTRIGFMNVAVVHMPGFHRGMIQTDLSIHTGLPLPLPH